MTRIVLASASPRRLELLRSVGFDVTVVPSDYDEREDASLTPLQLAQRHARGKLDALVGGSPLDSARSARYAQLVVAADTVVDVDGVALGKPRDSADATRMLKLLSGREHVVHTAFALRIPTVRSDNVHWSHVIDEVQCDGVTVEESESTRVRFCVLSDADVAAYVATGEPMDKAGAYGIQGRAAALVAGVDGDFYTVMGFPLGRFLRALQRHGIVNAPA